MIYGIGIDMVEVSRIQRNIERHGQRFVERIATKTEAQGEAGTKSRRSQYWAARFAVKEAFAKALGTGIGKTVPWGAVGVKKSKSGKPSLEFAPKLQKHLARLGINRSHVAITHTGDTAVAVVILEGTPV